MYRIQKFIKKIGKRADGFGYDILLRKEQFVTETNVYYTNEDQFGEDLARSEDNKILESIYKKFSKISSIKKNKIGQFVASENGITAIVLWTNGYLNIEDTNPEDFKPYWQETDSRKDYGSYYQGSIKGVPVYIVYKFQEHKTYSDSIFVFGQDAFSVSEFEIERDPELDETNTKWAENASNCLLLSITNLSALEEARTKVVEKWIEKDLFSVVDKSAKIEELKTNVIFKFFKGLSIDDLILNKTKLKVFHIE
jgi:hypothetical protein